MADLIQVTIDGGDTVTSFTGSGISLELDGNSLCRTCGDSVLHPVERVSKNITVAHHAAAHHTHVDEGIRPNL